MPAQKNCAVANSKPADLRSLHAIGHKNPRGRITLIGKEHEHDRR